MNATQYAQTIRAIDANPEMPYTKSQQLCRQLHRLLGYERARAIAAQCMERSFSDGYLSYAKLAQELRYEYNRVYALTQGCACENCKFIRTEWAWIGAQKARLELEPMTPGYRITVQENIDHETGRLNRAIAAGCHVIK